MDITINKCRGLRGTLRVPGDKSISHRALILGAMAEGTQRITGAPPSEDIQSTIRCLRRLGASVTHERGGTVVVTGGRWNSGQTLPAGNSGTTARLLSGLVAGKSLDCRIDGDSSLRKRPMERVADPLRLMGAEVVFARGGYLPMWIGGGQLNGIDYPMPVPSAQVKSAVLIAGLQAEGETTTVERMRTRDHTERMLKAMGVEVRTETLTDDGPSAASVAVSVTGGAVPRATELQIPGDISSAMFFVCAAAVARGSEVRLTGVGVNPTRTGALEILKKMGADIQEDNLSSANGEERAEIVIRSGELKGADVGDEVIPFLIDELPVLAVVATQAEGTSVVRGARELRYKESDRIRAIVDNLRKLGARIEEFADGFAVEGPCVLRGGIVSSYGDHRIAMAMAVAGLVAKGGVKITGSSATEISYPGFFDDLGRLAN